jgi:hypothetical protein
MYETLFDDLPLKFLCLEFFRALLMKMRVFWDVVLVPG